MGLEAACVGSFDGQESPGTARLEHDRLTFRGAFRLSLPLTGARVRVGRGRLTITAGTRTLTLTLGNRADTWARAIATPKGLHEKLGLRPGLAVGIAGPVPEDFLADLKASGLAPRSFRKGIRGLDVVFVAAEHARALKRLGDLRSAIAPAGAVWVLRPRGVRDITEAQVMAAGKAAGLVDVKVVRFSDTHTAEKFVVPKANR